MSAAPSPLTRVAAGAWRHAAHQAIARAVPEEIAVALTYNHETFAVMMATPADLEDFAIGFSLSEAIISHPGEILSLDIAELPEGLECRMALAPQEQQKLQARRRRLAGPVGCGLCGMESLKETLRPVPRVPTTTQMPAAALADSFRRMRSQQTLNNETRAVHAAAFFAPGQELLVREDIGRHNALDKLIGAAARQNMAAGAGAILLTSRVSLDLVQKCAQFGAGILAAISVPTARAVREADAANITLIAVARDDGFEIFTHPERITLEPHIDVA